MAAQTYPVARYRQTSRPDSAAGPATRKRRSDPPGGEGAGMNSFPPSAGISGTSGIVPSASMPSPDDAARASRARLIKAQAEAQEMENAKNRGYLLSVAMIERAWGEMAMSFQAPDLVDSGEGRTSGCRGQFDLRSKGHPGADGI